MWGNHRRAPRQRVITFSSEILIRLDQARDLQSIINLRTLVEQMRVRCRNLGSWLLLFRYKMHPSAIVNSELATYVAYLIASADFHFRVVVAWRIAYMRDISLWVQASSFPGTCSTWLSLLSSQHLLCSCSQMLVYQLMPSLNIRLVLMYGVAKHTVPREYCTVCSAIAKLMKYSEVMLHLNPEDGSVSRQCHQARC